MSTITTTGNNPAPRPIESAPSSIVNVGPTFARLVGFLGFTLFILGVVVVVATRAVGPRWVPEGWGFMSGALGLALMLYHAASDGELEIRRVYGGAALFLLLFAVIVSLIPGSAQGVASKQIGYYLLPWGVGAALVGLLFTVSFCRHETEESYLNVAVNIELVGGALLTVGSVAAGIFKPDFLAGPGIALSLLGVAFLCAYFGSVDTSQGIGYTVAFALGAVGGLIAVYAVGRVVIPSVLYDGPSVLRKSDQSLDTWKVFGRGAVILGFAGLTLVGLLGRYANWLRATFVLLGLLGLGVFVTATLSNPLTVQPKPFLVPGGVVLFGIGLAYLVVALGVCSDNQLVTLVRRELSAYFLSPIGFLVLGGMVLAQWLSYLDFVGTLSDGRARREPIVQLYGAHILNLFVYAVQIPILTMRLLAEEKRTGSLEVLLTAPVNEASVVVSKFLGTLFFFLVCWLPVGLFLIALRVEGDQPFDYRPLLGFYVGLAAQGGMFIAMGLFFSSLTKNQIVAAVLTFVVLESLLFFALLRENPLVLALPDALLAVAGRLSFYHMWAESLSGQLPIRDVLLAVSLTIFGLFLTVKVLEIRKWS